MIKQIVFSVFVTAAVSLLFAYGLSNVLGFGRGVALGVVLQTVGFSLYLNYCSNRQVIEHENIINERLDILSKNVVTFQCPCGKGVFDEIIYINDDNTFECTKCDQQIKVEVTLTPIVKTNPLNVAEAHSKLQQLVDNTEGTSV